MNDSILTNQLVKIESFIVVFVEEYNSYHNVLKNDKILFLAWFTAI